MAKRLVIQELVDALAPEIREAFLRSIADIKSDAQMKLLIEAIQRRDMDDVLRLLNLERAYFAPLDAALAAAYASGGDAAMSDLMSIARSQGAAIRARFDAKHPRALSYLERQGAALVTGPTGMLAEIRENVRRVVSADFDAGLSPRATALNLVGRINRATGRREGGVIGLHAGQISSRDRALAELLSGDPERLRNYLTRKTRDKRSDSVVKRAIREGKPVPADQARAMIARMENTMLRQRGEMIGRTEMLGSINHANHEAIEQLIDRGDLNRDSVTNEWDSSEDSATRPSHAAMNGQQRVQGEAFVSGDGNSLMYPGDRSQGAPASDTINCRCFLRRRIDFIGDAIARGTA